jgi:3-oxoacyl-[acyl-carrier protein] reductase
MVASMKPEVLDNICKGVPLNRMGEPAEIGNAVAYIVESDYFTGRLIEMDGGLRL